MDMMVWEGDGHNKECPNPLALAVSTPPKTLKWSPYHGESSSPPQTECTPTSSQKRMRPGNCYTCSEAGHWSPECPLSSQKIMRPGNCFGCGKQGHWLRDCPSQPSIPERDKHDLPVLRCHCSLAYWMGVSQTDSNPGRRFYSRTCNCRDVMVTEQGVRLEKFMWVDEFKATAPPCDCGAGACTINFQKHTQEDGTVTYTEYYTCRIRMGHGACGYLLFPTPSKHGHVSRLSSKSKINARQIKFWNQISAAAGSSNGCKLQMLSLQWNGWAGRFVFRPSRFLADPPLRHFFCCTYPLFNPILVESMNVSDSGNSRIIPHSSSNDKEDATSLVLNEVGKKLRKGLVFRSMESPDNDASSQAANSAFDAWACLSSESGPSAECVMKIIQSILRIVEMGSTVHDNCDVQVSTEHDSVDECLGNISVLHSEASISLRSICKMVCRFKNRLLHMEEVLGYCKTEIVKMETLILDLTKEVGQSKRNMQAAYQEVRKASKLKQREEGQRMEKTGFEETCSSSSENPRKRLKVWGGEL